MRIGILSLTLHTNYGGILQSYALQTILKRMHHDVKIIYRPLRENEHQPLMTLRYLKRAFCKYILRQKVSIFNEKRYNHFHNCLESYTSQFIYKNLDTFQINSFNDIKPTDFDCFVVGSDQVWRPKYFKQQYKTGIENAFLSFARNWNVKRISYAASFGTDEWEYTEEETKCCEGLIKLFNGVSVREQSGISLCEKYLHNNACCLLDPTLLLEKEDYLNLIDNKLSEGNLMVYVLDKNEDIDRLVNIVVTDNHLIPFYPNIRKEAELSIPPIENWIKGFRDAQFVVTDSFHACVLSIIFNKPFIVIGNKNRGYSRFDNLLNMFHLENRLIDTSSQYNHRLLEPLPASIYKELELKRKESYDYIKECL